MEHVKVESSNIESIGYESGIMEVRFKNGGLYQYRGVSKDDYNELINAKSVGKHLNQMGIKGRKIEQEAKQ